MSYIEVLSCFTVFEGLGLGVTQGDYLHEGKTLKIKFFFNLLDQIMSKKKKLQHKLCIVSISSCTRNFIGYFCKYFRNIPLADKFPWRPHHKDWFFRAAVGAVRAPRVGEGVFPGIWQSITKNVGEVVTNATQLARCPAESPLVIAPYLWRSGIWARLVWGPWVMWGSSRGWDGAARFNLNLDFLFIHDEQNPS